MFYRTIGVGKLQNWNKVLNLKEKEERLKEINMDIASEKFVNDTFRKKFLLMNSKWLRENLKFVFTPRTLKLYIYIYIIIIYIIYY